MCTCWGTVTLSLVLQVTFVSLVSMHEIQRSFCTKRNTDRKTHIKLEATRKILKTSMSHCFFLDWLIGQDKRQEGEAWFRTVGLLKLGPGRRDDALWRKVQGTVGGKKGFVCKQNCCHKQRHVWNRRSYKRLRSFRLEEFIVFCTWISYQTIFRQTAREIWCLFWRRPAGQGLIALVELLPLCPGGW